VTPDETETSHDREALDRRGRVYDLVGRTKDGKTLLIEFKAPPPKRTRRRRRPQ
jgi:hypothetical protein